jgi:hypothetical protein
MADALNLGDLANPISVGLGVLQTGIGIVDDINNKAKQKKYLGQLKAYKTPQEIFDILNASQNNASQGLDATTLNYLTNQTDQAFSSSIGTANRLGADPNDLSAIFSQKVNSIMQIGVQNHQANMANFSQYLGALGLVADNKAAEFKSQQDIIKNKLQTTGVNLQTATNNISGGLNTLLSTLSADKIANMYNPDGTLKVKKAAVNPITGLAVDNTNQNPYA